MTGPITLFTIAERIERLSIESAIAAYKQGRSLPQRPIMTLLHLHRVLTILLEGHLGLGPSVAAQHAEQFVAWIEDQPTDRIARVLDQALVNTWVVAVAGKLVKAGQRRDLWFAWFDLCDSVAPGMPAGSLYRTFSR